MRLRTEGAAPADALVWMAEESYRKVGPRYASGRQKAAAAGGRIESGCAELQPRLACLRVDAKNHAADAARETAA